MTGQKIDCGKVHGVEGEKNPQITNAENEHRWLSWRLFQKAKDTSEYLFINSVL